MYKDGIASNGEEIKKLKPRLSDKLSRGFLYGMICFRELFSYGQEYDRYN